MNFPAFGLIDLPDRPQVEGIGDERVKRVRRHSDNTPAANSGRRPIQCFR